MSLYVEIIETATDKVVHRIECHGTQRDAERTERGVNINLNHEAFHTRVVEEQS